VTSQERKKERKMFERSSFEEDKGRSEHKEIGGTGIFLLYFSCMLVCGMTRWKVVKD